MLSGDPMEQPAPKAKRGRPVGSVNPINRRLREVAPEIIDAAVNEALGGNVPAMALLLSRALPPARAVLPLVGVATAQALAGTSPAERALLVEGAALSGQMPADVAAALLDGIAKSCQIFESTDLAERLAALEAKADENR